MGLRICTFKQEYRSGVDNLVVDFYHRALQHASQYWRAVGFFSSSAFEVIGSPMGEFVGRGGTMRLITSVALSLEDQEAIQSGLDLQSACETHLLKQLEDEFESPFGKGTLLLTQMLATGALEIRVAVPAHGVGMYHEKVGVFLVNHDDDYVTFSGSSNESFTALQVNYECVDVYSSWEDPGRAAAKRRHFELLWGGKAEGTLIFSFPEAVSRALIRRVEHSSHRQGASTAVEKQSKWIHQEQAVSAFLTHRRGILEMATGTGKTRTALRICDQLLRDHSIETVIICTDGTDLLNQWYKQLIQLAKDEPFQIAVYRHYEIYRDREAFLTNPRYSILLCSREHVPPALKRLQPEVAAKTLLVYDEVHGLGSPANREALDDVPDAIPFRLGLSATPEREYDQDGNVFLERHLGPTLFSFSLEDAIRRQILCPFRYFPLEYVPDQNDKDRLASVFAKASWLAKQGTPMSTKDRLIELARVYKTSEAKIPVFEAFLRQHSEMLQRCIIFVEEREYGERVLELVHRYRADFHTYFGGDDSDNLRLFARGDIQCLLTCHRLSEGIDIKSIETVVLFSSARSRLETVQRIGRCLRVDPSNPRKLANVVDFIRRTPDNGDDGDVVERNSDEVREDWLTSLSTIRPGDHQ